MLLPSSRKKAWQGRLTKNLCEALRDRKREYIRKSWYQVLSSQVLGLRLRLHHLQLSAIAHNLFANIAATLSCIVKACKARHTSVINRYLFSRFGLKLSASYDA